MKKIFLLLLFCFIFSGCTARYELKINKDLSVDEKITGLENSSFYDMFASSKRNVANYALSSGGQYIPEHGYTVSEVSDDDLYGLSVSKKYISFDEYYSLFSLYSPYYEYFNYSNDGGIYTISLSNKIIDDSFSNRYIVDDGEIVITLPFKVLENNADKVYNSDDGVSYMWKFDMVEDKDIFLKFDSTSLKDTNSYLFVYIFVCILLLIFSFLIYKYYIKKKENKDKF